MFFSDSSSITVDIVARYFVKIVYAKVSKLEVVVEWRKFVTFVTHF